MGKIHLTDAAVGRYRRPLKGRIEVSDTEPGLFLWITPNGTKSWVVTYRLSDAGGKRSIRRKMVIGRHPATGVAEARRIAGETMQLAAQGIDPEAQAAAAREAAELEAARRFNCSVASASPVTVALIRPSALVNCRASAKVKGGLLSASFAASSMQAINHSPCSRAGFCPSQFISGASDES